MCPSNATSVELGSAGCFVPVRGPKNMEEEAAVVIEFSLRVVGTSFANIADDLGVASDPKEVLQLLVRQDAAEAFSAVGVSVSLADISISGVEAGPGSVIFDVSVIIPTGLGAAATEAEIFEGLLDVGRLSADPGMELLADSPEVLFHRTKLALNASVAVEEPAQARDNLPSDMRDTRTWLHKLPLPWPYILGILLGVVVVLYVGLRLRQGTRAFLFRRELSAKTKGSKGTAKSKAKKRDLGVLGQKALSKLAAFKKEKAKEPLERMWERRSQGQAYYSDYTT